MKVLNPKVIECNVEKETLKTKQKLYYDKTAAREEKQFKAKKIVFIQNKFSKQQRKSIITDKTK